MEENNTNNIRAVILGIPGVGKTTVISKVVKSLEQRGFNTATVIFGTVMFEEAKKMGLKNRDEIRKLSISKQRLLQQHAAKRIAKMHENIVIIDTHLFIKTSEWYYPGIPMQVIDIIKPTHLLLVMADPEEVIKRRKNDSSRHRDILSTKEIQHELDISKMMIVSCANLTGSPFAIIMNNSNEADNTSSDIIRILVGT
ncbi:MAG TPA: adenylate kinase [Nitrososphaeraceae archaeon]